MKKSINFLSEDILSLFRLIFPSTDRASENYY